MGDSWDNETQEVTLKDAVTNVQILEELPIVDDQPMIEGFSLNLYYQVNFDTNFEDRNAYVTGCSKYIEEATRHAEFCQMLEEGFVHAGNLYTWRCCSRAVPMPKSNDQPNRGEINDTVVSVFQPEVDKLYAFMYFTNNAMSRFCEEIRRLCHPEKRKDFVSESYLLILGKFLNMFAILDELKNMKASIKNDFSTYRRAVQSNHNSVIQPDLHQMNNLSLFLATQNKIKETLRSEVHDIEGHEELLSDVINICANFFETKFYVAPEEKYLFVKAIAFALFLLDGSLAKIDQKKRISISRLDRIFKSVEVVPLFGDMQIQPFSFIRRSAVYDSSKWPLSNNEGTVCHVHIAEKVRTIRAHHDEFVAHVARIKNEVSVYNKEGRSDAENREMTTVALFGLQLLCSWTSDVVETVSWKLLNPTNHRDNPECPESAENYERATRYNYSSEEKAALIETIAMIKGVQALLGRMEAEFSMAIRRHVYAELQDFVQQTLAEPLYRAVKNKKDVLSAILTAVIETCVDDFSGQFKSLHASDVSMLKSRKKKAEMGSAGDLRVARRPVAPSSTQLYMARTMVECLISERGGRKHLRKEIDPKVIDKLQNFHRTSYYWPALMRYADSLEACCDLSQLWFREFYLEMTMGQRIQFPIEMSMPWILTDHILTTEQPGLVECILYQLDLYNDAANYSLRKFRKRFLYDECEAEVNLCFDQFIFKLSEAIYRYYKQTAACMLLDKGFKAECLKLGINIRKPSSTRYDVLLRQRHFMLLGRQIDLNKLLTQRIKLSVQRSLDFALSKFESEGLHWIVTLEELLKINRLTHRLLSEHLPSLPEFDEIFLEINHQVYSSNGRVTLHAYMEVVSDLIPNFCFNSTTWRFTRSAMAAPRNREKPPPPNPAFEFGSGSLNASFYNLCAMYCKFVGPQHFQALARIIGYRGIAALIDDLLIYLRRLINIQLKEHIRSLFNLVPKVCKLPRYDYGSEAVLQYYVHHLREVFSYTPLRSDCYQILREIGNILLFILQLELALANDETADLHAASAYLGSPPTPPAKYVEEQENKVRFLTEKFARINIPYVIGVIGTRKQAEIADSSKLLTNERLCCGLSIFEMVLSKVKDMLISDTIWRGSFPPNGVMWVDECVEFHRIWSAIQFVLSVPQVNQEQGLLPEATFGDGLNFAGCALIRLLGQWRRFEVFDFTYHLLRVHRATPAKATPSGKSKEAKNAQQDSLTALLPPIVERIRRIQMLHNQFFALIGNYMKTLDDHDENINVREFAPPVHPKFRQNVAVNEP